MDFRVAENLLSLNTEASNNGGSLASGTDADVNNLTLYGSLFLNRESPPAENDSPAAKVAGISSRGGDTAKISLQQSINGGASAHPRHQMLSFSAYNSPPLSFPFGRSSPGYGVRGPFTSSQWMELEHQALIYKYITANVPIPSYLLLPIRKAFESSGISCFSLLRSNALGWGGFQLGFSKNDPEPGRCRRTDGKKWRCSRDAVPDQKYCERHVNRGRHRSRKHVEAGTTTNTTTAAAAAPAPSSVNRAIREKESAVAAPPKLNEHNAPTSSEFGSVCSDSLLNPLSSSHALRHFIDEWPKSHPETRPRSAKDKCETDEATKMGLGIGPAVHSVASEQSQRHNYWVPTSWEPSAGGPLGEALHATSNGEGKCTNKRARDFMETRLHSSSPVGARRGGPGAESGDGTSFCNGIISSGFMLPSLPAL